MRQMPDVPVVAAVLVSGAFAECCEDMLGRLAAQTSFRAEVENFRSRALFRVVRALSADDLVASVIEVQAAMDRINEVCDGWLWETARSRQMECVTEPHRG